MEAMKEEASRTGRRLGSLDCLLACLDAWSEDLWRCETAGIGPGQEKERLTMA